MAEEREYRGLRNLKTPEALSEKRKELEQLRSKDKREWALNKEFYRGNQWAFYNSFTDRVEALGTEAPEKPRYRVRLVANQIKPGVQHWVAQLTKNRPVVHAVPDSGGDGDVKAAQMASQLYEWWWQEFSLNTKLPSALVEAALSQGYWKITYDPLAGKQMKFMVNPETGQVITDDELSNAFKETLRENGVDPEEYEQTVMVGDIRVEVMAGENVLLDPVAKNFEDSNYAICIHSMEPDEIEARWKIKVEPDAVPGAEEVTLAFVKSTDRPRTTKQVYIMYMRPNPSVPKGRYVVWIESPDKILVDTPWPYPFNELPLVKFPGIERPNSPYDDPPTNDARSINVELNKTLSQIIEHRNLTLKPQMMAPAGSLRQRMTSEPGAIFEYNIVAGMQPPEWREMPGLPGYVFDQIGDFQRRLDMIYNRLPSQRDQLPARIDNAGGIDLLQEAVSDQLSPIVIRLEAALARAGMLMVYLAQKYYIEPRLLKIRGTGGSTQVKKFLNADLVGGFSFHAEAGSGLPRTRAGKQARIEFMIERQMIRPQDGLKYLDHADMAGVRAMMQADEDQALREHDKLLKGQPINPAAMQEALGALQQGINPMTGQPLQSDEEAQQVLMAAALEPLPYENSPEHISTHDLWMKSVEFEQLSPEIQHAAVMHRMLTIQALQAQAPQPPPEQPKVTMQVKATTSAPVAGEILRKSGIEVTDEQVAMPPLETWVTDSMDKIDQDEAGNDPLTEVEQLMGMQQAMDKHQASMARSAHDVSLAEAKSRQTSVTAVRAKHDSQRAEEMHQAKLEQARQPKKPSGR